MAEEAPITKAEEKPQAASELKFDDSIPVHMCGFKNVRIDYNLGCRIYNPEGNTIRAIVKDRETSCIISDTIIKAGEISIVGKKYYIDTMVTIEDTVTGETYEYVLDLKGKPVFIRFPQGVMGDVLAWFGYAEEFRKAHRCEVYVDVNSAMRELFKPMYPDLHFIDRADEEEVKPLATYYMGIFFPSTDRTFQPMDFRFGGLYQAAPRILGLPDREIKPKVFTGTKERLIKEKYVCIAVHSTSQCKYWNNIFGWNSVVEHLKELGYRVICIDRDRDTAYGRFQNTIPRGCEDFTGNIPLAERASMLAHADFFIGVSSGLAWLAWACGTPVLMISGFTLPFNEFYTPYRVINFNTCTGCWHYHQYDHHNYGFCPEHEGTAQEFECSRLISGEMVNNTIDKIVEDLKQGK